MYCISGRHLSGCLDASHLCRSPNIGHTQDNIDRFPSPSSDSLHISREVASEKKPSLPPLCGGKQDLGSDDELKCDKSAGGA